jgi:uncharacterized protein (DUF342 family)
MADVSAEEMRERLGNVDQIRDLLFGHKSREYDQRFDKCEQRLSSLESTFTNFQSEIRDRITQLQDSLSTEIRSALDALEKKQKYLTITTQESAAKLQQELNQIDQKTAHGIVALHQNLTSQGNALESEISQVRHEFGTEIQNLRNQIFDEFSKEISGLKDSRVSRAALAEVLFELCLKIKQNDFVTELSDGMNNAVKAELLLPEQQ